MKDAVEDPGGDLRAVEGTEAEVAILTDRPLTKGVLMLGDDQQIELKSAEAEQGIGSPPTSRSTRTACITSRPSIAARTSA